MCRHKGIGMNKPKKKEVEVLKYVRVKVLVRGVSCEPESEPEPPHEEPPPVPGAIDPWEWAIQYAERAAKLYKKKSDILGGIIREAVRGKRRCMLRMKGLRKRPQEATANELRVWRKATKKACIELEEEISQYSSVEADARHEKALKDRLQDIWLLAAARCKVDRYEGKPYRRVTVPRHLRQMYKALM